MTQQIVKLMQREEFLRRDIAKKAFFTDLKLTEEEHARMSLICAYCPVSACQELDSRLLDVGLIYEDENGVYPTSYNGFNLYYAKDGSIRKQWL